MPAVPLAGQWPTWPTTRLRTAPQPLGCACWGLWVLAVGRRAEWERGGAPGWQSLILRVPMPPLVFRTEGGCVGVSREAAITCAPSWPAHALPTWGQARREGLSCGLCGSSPQCVPLSLSGAHALSSRLLRFHMVGCFHLSRSAHRVWPQLEEPFCSRSNPGSSPFLLGPNGFVWTLTPQAHWLLYCEVWGWPWSDFASTAGQASRCHFSKTSCFSCTEFRCHFVIY